MKRRCLLLAAVMSAAGALALETPSFERYRPIIDRAPFGKADPALISATSSNFMARFAFVGLIGAADSSTGLQAVILDKQTNQCYFKTPGETIEDVTIVRIEDAQPKRRLLLRRGLEVGMLIFGEGGAKPVAAPAPTAAAGPLPAPPGTPAPEPTAARRRIPFVR